MKKALVTGATGFIGRHLVSRLVQEGHEVTCLVRQTSNIEHLREFGVRLAYGDVRDAASLPQAMAGADVVYHLAGILAAFTREGFAAVNAAGVKNVVQTAARHTTPPTVVVVSSIAACGPSANGTARCESGPSAPVSHYGKSKLEGEEAAHQWASEVPITVVRPPIVFGEHDQEIFKLFRAASLGVFPVPGVPPGRISVVYAGDLAHGCMLAAERGERLPQASTPAPGQGYYYFCFEQTPGWDTFGRYIGEALGRKKLRLLPVPHALTWLVCGASEGLARLRGKPSVVGLDKAREGTAGDWLFSAEKAKQQLGFAAPKTLTERLAQTGQWYVDNGWLRAPRKRWGPSTALTD